MSARRESAGDTAAVAGGATVAGTKRWWSLVALCLSAAIVWFAAANLPVAVPAISGRCAFDAIAWVMEFDVPGACISDCEASR